MMEKYLVASSGDSLDSKVSGRFGHSGFFLIVDPVTMEYKAFEGVTTYEDPDIEKYINPSVKKVIVGNIGPAAYNDVTSYGCKIYLCRNMPVPEAIRKVRNGEIKALGGPTLKASIHSARKTGYKYGGHGEPAIPGISKSAGAGEFAGRGMNRGAGRGMGRSNRQGSYIRRGTGFSRGRAK